MTGAPGVAPIEPPLAIPAPVGHVLLDRDGVLNREGPGWIDDPAAWRWEQGAERALAHLAACAVPVSIVTNQSGIGRGVVAHERVDALHRWLAAEVEGRGVRLVGIFTCPHAPEAGCSCRKPGPGLVRQALAAAATGPEVAVLVGDDERDLVAARRAGIGAVLVRTGKGRAIEADGRWSGPVHDDVEAAVAAVLGAPRGPVG